MDDDDDNNSIHNKDSHTASTECNKPQKDGSYAHHCPIDTCQTKTFKLKRHLESLHSDLTRDQIDYAISLSKRFSRNKRNGGDKVKVNTDEENVQPVKKMKKISNNLVSRKYNYKQCSLCSKLYLNLSDHLTKTHKINRNNEHYDR